MASSQGSLSLERQCLDSDLVELSQLIHDWREIAPVLGLTQTDELNILGSAPNSVPAQRTTMLRTWSQRHGQVATYYRLADAFWRCGRVDLVERVSQLANQRTPSIGEP